MFVLTECQYVLLPVPYSYCGLHRIYRTYCMYRCGHLPADGHPGLLLQFPDLMHIQTVHPNPVPGVHRPSYHQYLLHVGFPWLYLLHELQSLMQ